MSIAPVLVALRRWRARPIVLAAVVLALVASAPVAFAVSSADAGTTPLSQGRPAIASSTENAGTPASAAVDGNGGSRWSSAFSDPQWLQVPTATPAGPVSGGGPLGPNVIVFDSGMSGAAIQSQVDTTFNQMQSNQFGTQRYALLFKPGAYSGFNAQIGFYTSIAGLGQNPDDVTIHGDVTIDAGWLNGNATQNFWRSAENFSIYPSAGFTRWAVAQAAPFRRVDVHGDLNLAPNGFGWASGGYLNGVWNMVFSGVQGAPARGFPKPAYTVLPQTPTSPDKPNVRFHDLLTVSLGGNGTVRTSSTTPAARRRGPRPSQSTSSRTRSEQSRWTVRVHSVRPFTSNISGQE